MRTLVSVLWWIVAVVAGTVAVPVTWLADNVADESGYVELTRTLRDDEKVRSAVADVVAADLVRDLGAPDVVREQLAQQLQSSFEQWDDLEGFAAAWDESQRRSHARWFDAHRVPDQLQLDVAPLAALVVNSISPAAPLQIPVPDHVIVTVASTPPGMEAVATTPTWKAITLIAAGAATVLCLVFARRRSTAIAWIGVGALAVAGLCAVGARVVVPSVLERAQAGASAVADSLSTAMSERFMASLDSWLQLLAIAGGILVVVGLIARAVTGRGR